jgi:hypothetical protein
MRARLVLAGAALSALAGCSHEVARLNVTSDSLVGPEQHASVACPLRLVEVLDQRPDHDTGGLGWNQLVVEDPPTLVREQLLKSGLLSAEASTGMPVSVRLKQMYLHQDNMTKNPVVVYEATVDGGAPFLVRAQPSIGNWNSSKNETVSAFSRALRLANSQLVSELNRRCPG